MISWIQRSFQQHFKWLFLLLLAVVIVSFVFITNASSGLGHNTRQAPARPFFGVNLSSPEDTQQLFKDATLSVQLQGAPIRDENELEQYSLQRHAALHLADQLNLPEASAEELTRHIQTLRLFSGPDGKFDAVRYAEFRDTLKTNPQISEGDIARVLSDDVRYQKVLKLLSGPGYVLPADVAQQLRRSEATWTLEAVTVDYASFSPKIDVTDEALSQYFEYNAPRYEIPAKVGVSYIDFPASAYESKVEVTDAGLRAYYESNPARFPKPADDAKSIVPSTPDSDFDAVRHQVEQAYRNERARALAMAAASDFAVELFDQKVDPETLDAFLSKHGLTRKSVAPFDAASVPAELGSDRRIAAAAFQTGPQHPFSDPVNTPRGAAILVWSENVPATQPELAAVKERVTADYIEAEKRKLFVEAGRTLRDALAARLKTGASLSDAVAASSDVIPAKLSTKSWPSFSLARPPQDFDYSLYGAIDSLQKGELSQMVATGEKGVIAYAVDKQVPEVDPSSPRYAEIRDRMASFTASRNGGARLAAIVEAELAKTAPAIL